MPAQAVPDQTPSLTGQATLESLCDIARAIRMGNPTERAWMMAGSLVTVAIAQILKVDAKAAPGTPPARAWRHGAVMAASVGIVVYLVEHYEVRHGYWVAVTLTVVLRPLAEDPRARANQRILGTVGGVVLALEHTDRLARTDAS